MQQSRLAKVLCIMILAAFLVAGCGGQKAGDSGNKEKLASELNLFIWSEYIPQAVLDKFQEKYGIKVNLSHYSSNEEMLAKLQAGGASQYDLAVATDYMVEIMLKQKQPIIQAFDVNNIPNLKNIDPQYKNKFFDPDNQYTVAYMCGSVLLAVNTDKVKEPVKSYKDLLNPGLKNSLVVLDDQRAIIGIGLKILGYSLNETDPRKLAEAKAQVAKLIPNIKAYDSDSPKTLLINGEAAIGYVWNAEASLAKKENPAIEVVFPEEGMYLWQDNFVLTHGAPHKREAELFMNFILEPEISLLISKEFPYTNPNMEAVKLLDKALLEDKAVYPPTEALAKGEFLKDLGQATRVYDEIWSELKTK
ncbi:spermidine/putrescine ABC transporter substrate-binding protein [Acetonema longum]|uniref:polyamine ABC transporter substrate-binding protein n=1 Tax=Acetonema longum TaxID=2374 RepID=UPI0002FAA240|nr:spermidine/putrescine ABC transporter substrate-binding protein [Acetonema longum]